MTRDDCPSSKKVIQTFSLQIFETYLTYSGEHEKLQNGSSGQAYTLFAPWDYAFDELDEDTWHAHLVDLINYHIYQGDLPIDQVQQPTQLITMWNGETVELLRVPNTARRMYVNSRIQVLATYDASDGCVRDADLAIVVAAASGKNTMTTIPSFSPCRCY